MTAFGVSMLVEAPMMGLEKIIFKSQSQENKPATSENDKRVVS